MSYEEYPRMLHHKELGQKIVHGPGEMGEMIRCGWSVSPTGMSDEELLEAKIRVLEGELEVMRENLASMRKEKDEDEDDGRNILAQPSSPPKPIPPSLKPKK